jgi:hypothetical protein
MLGVSNRPFSPLSRSSLLESLHGLQWAGDQVYRVGDAGDPAPRLDFHYTLFEQPLTTPCPNDGLPMRSGAQPLRSRPKPAAQ